MLKLIIAFCFSLFLKISFTQTNNNVSGIENVTFLTSFLNIEPSAIGSIAEKFKFVSISPETIHFFVFTPQNEIIEINYLTACDTIDLTKETKFIIHGWQSNATMDFIVNMAKAYHNKTNNNIIGVDWKRVAKQNYIYAAQAVKSVGEFIGDFIVNITRQESNFINKTHLIGHSLGAHVSGFAGKRVLALLQKPIGRITGMDAAGPLFEVPLPRSARWRLDKSDANFVDLLHTNVGFYGVRWPYGDLDVYINKGGPIQPHCANKANPYLCSHMSAPTYQIESVQIPEWFYGISCPMDLLYNLQVCGANKKAIMGEFTSRDASGLYFLELNLDNKLEQKISQM